MVDEVKREDEEVTENLDEEAQIVEEVTEEIEEENEKYELLQESFLRLQADFTNYKRRTEQEKQDYLNLGATKIINDLLPIVDNFERALENKEEGKFYEGVEMIYAQIEGLLERNGVEEIKALNEKFDPNFHHAVLVEEAKDVESDTVIDVLQKGYKLGEKVLRPAMVKVSQ
ncbi:nucleotide exchange factor GrpE [Peptoniphilus stercorisuis]|uniref:Protein GrpE n=1 Tax=Peptoniphilus stercorisuis TaxID=1436965 RepID=A0ABS4KC91_9FIRM|nr:nucleotide exchange factor GrpE [Peptoniphilus stercorisuis]MBP2024781.1 molecular chaperone GrpE [Peptoniphilus stercorisuis]